MASTDRRQVILAESAKLFSERGISATTIREIGDASGLNSGTLYHYFTSKDAIVSEILVRFLTDLIERYDAVVDAPMTARDRLTQIVRASFETADRHPYSTEIYQNEFANLTALPRHTEIVAAVESSHRAWMQVVEDGVRTGEFDSKIGVFEFQRMMREAVFMSVRWHRDSLAQDIDHLTDTLMTVFLEGFASGPARGKKTRGSGARVRAARGPSEITDESSATADVLRAQNELLRAENESLRSALQEIRALTGSIGDLTDDR